MIKTTEGSKTVNSHPSHYHPLPSSSYASYASHRLSIYDACKKNFPFKIFNFIMIIKMDFSMKFISSNFHNSTKVLLLLVYVKLMN